MYQQLNYVSFNGIECKVNGTSFKDHIYNRKNMVEIQKIGSIVEIGWHYEDEIEPIKITEKWLERLGFVKNGNHWDYAGFSFIVHSTGLNLWRPKPDYHVNYVHELQNWFYAYRGEELLID